MQSCSELCLGRDQKGCWALMPNTLADSALATSGKALATAAYQQLGIMERKVLVKVLPSKACCNGIMHVLLPL